VLVRDNDIYIYLSTFLVNDLGEEGGKRRRAEIGTGISVTELPVGFRIQ